MLPEEMAEQVGALIKEYVEKATKPLLEQIATLKTALESLPEPKDGKDGADGQPGADGKPGEPGKDGKDGLNGKDGVDGQDGAAGTDGKNAPEIDIMLSINEKNSYPKGLFAKHKGGLWVSRRQTSGMDGWECIIDGIDKVSFQKTGERDFACLIAKSSGEVIKSEFGVPMMIYRGIHKEGLVYSKGDCTTWGGSLWHCDEANNERPGEGKGWTLCAKRGRDGQRGEKGGQGIQGYSGKDGKDLTQMGADGRKW